MIDGRTPEQIADEAERILNSTIFKGALERLETAALEDLLAANGEDADIVRREKADLVKVIRTIPQAIRVEMLSAQKQTRPRPSVA